MLSDVSHPLLPVLSEVFNFDHEILCKKWFSGMELSLYSLQQHEHECLHTIQPGCREGEGLKRFFQVSY